MLKRRLERLEATTKTASIQLMVCPPDATFEEAYRIYHENLRLWKLMPRPTKPVFDHEPMTLEEATRIFKENMRFDSVT